MSDHGLLPIQNVSEDPSVNSSFYKKIFDDFPALIWIAGTDAKCWYFNKSWLGFRGRTLDEEFGDGWTEGVHPDDFDRCVSYYLDHFEKRESFSMEYRLMRADGLYRWILDLGIPFYGLENEFRGYIGSCYDITEEKLTMADLNKSKETAQSALQAKSDLLSYVSHEIRNPLNVIIGYSDLLSRNDYDEETNSIIGYMNSSAHLLLGIVNNLLDLGKLEAAGVTYEKEPFEISKLEHEVEQIYRKRVEDNGLAFHSARIGYFPKHIYGDEMKLMQIITNLISNALKFTSAGFISLQYVYDSAAGNLILIFEDTGIGINQEKQARMFDQFVQGEKTIFKEYGGTGLGLSIVKNLVDLMGGTIEVATEIGKGTRFEIHINVLPPV